MNECERCGAVTDCEAVETHYLCRPCLDALDDAREAAEEARAEARDERYW